MTVTNKEIARLLYKASNGLYVLYENQEYKIVSGDLVINNVQDYFAYLNRLATENNMSNIPNKNGSIILIKIVLDHCKKNIMKNMVINI